MEALSRTHEIRKSLPLWFPELWAVRISRALSGIRRRSCDVSCHRLLSPPSSSLSLLRLFFTPRGMSFNMLYAQNNPQFLDASWIDGFGGSTSTATPTSGSCHRATWRSIRQEVVIPRLADCGFSRIPDHPLTARIRLLSALFSSENGGAAIRLHQGNPTDEYVVLCQNTTLKPNIEMTCSNQSKMTDKPEEADAKALAEE